MSAAPVLPRVQAAHVLPLVQVVRDPERRVRVRLAPALRAPVVPVEPDRLRA